jgi:endoglycosylceramidase
VDRSKLRALVVPHPLAVAGTPTAYGFDREGRRFHATWTIRRAGGSGRFAPGSRSRVAVPRLVYPRGYAVRVTGGRVVSAPGARTLVVAQADGARRVRLVVAPRRG